MYVTPSAPQSIGGVIDDAIRLYRYSFSRCWLLAFLPAAALGAWGILMAHYIPWYGAAYSPAAQITIAKQHPLPGVMIFYLLIVSLVALSFQGAVAARQAAVARRDDSFTFGRAFAAAFLRLPAFLLSAILLYLVLVGAAACLTLVVALPLGWLLGALHVMVRALASIGLVLLIVIGMLAVMGRLQLFMAAIYIDRAGPLASLKSSWRLTKGHWWRATAIMATAMIMLVVLYFAITVLSYLGGYLTHNGPAQRFLIAPLLVVVTYTVIYPLAAAIWVAMYNDFKLRREGSDLVARVGALNST
ncbi:MAG: hypothetical protein ACREVO_01840 [Steroidobacteraceae bacterium]